MSQHDARSEEWRRLAAGASPVLGPPAMSRAWHRTRPNRRLAAYACAEQGFRVVDVWESEEAFGRFGEKLMPILQELGVEGEPDIYPAHSLVSA